MSGSEQAMSGIRQQIPGRKKQMPVRKQSIPGLKQLISSIGKPGIGVEQCGSGKWMPNFKLVQFNSAGKKFNSDVMRTISATG
jgi:hypothetical protein